MEEKYEGFVVMITEHGIKSWYASTLTLAKDITRQVERKPRKRVRAEARQGIHGEMKQDRHYHCGDCDNIPYGHTATDCYEPISNRECYGACCEFSPRLMWVRRCPRVSEFIPCGFSPSQTYSRTLTCYYGNNESGCTRELGSYCCNECDDCANSTTYIISNSQRPFTND